MCIRDSDLFSPHEGQISLPVLADSCNIVTSGFGIVGLSCQLSSAEGTRVVKRGQVKDARRHFAHQAQLRLSLARSPNLSVKVFRMFYYQPILGLDDMIIEAAAERDLALAGNVSIGSTRVCRDVAFSGGRGNAAKHIGGL